MNHKLPGLFILLILSGTTLFCQEIEVTITGIRNGKGQIVIGVFRDDPTFRKEEAFLSKSFPKNNIVNGEMKVKFTLDPGVYGLSLLDDENNSGLMEYNLIGMPKEGFGFSDYYLTGLSRPKFDSFKFSLVKDQKKKTTIRIRYI